MKIVAILISFALLPQDPQQVNHVDTEVLEIAAANLRARIEASPRMLFDGVHFEAQPPFIDWETGAVSGVAVDGNWNIYEIQRGDRADPVLVLDENGKILCSWGKGHYKIPHSVRIDPAGNIWTVDAASSAVIKCTLLGKELMTITVGEQAENGSSFNGTTDVAFGPDGHIFTTNG